MHKNQNGFAPLYVMVAVIAVLLIGAVGYHSLHAKKQVNSLKSPSSTSNTAQNVETNSAQQASDDAYVSLDSYIANMSTADRLSNIAKSTKGLADCGNVSSSGVSTTINNCFETAFSSCKPVFAAANSSASGIVTRYVVLGHDTQTGHCIGGFYYTQPDDPTYKGLGTFCALDTSTKPFLQAMSKANSGTTKDLETRCKQPANPRHI